MDILKSKFNIIRIGLLSVFVFWCGITFYTNINKFLGIVVSAVLILGYIFLRENPESYDSFQTKIKKGSLVLLTVFLLFVIFQFYEPPYFFSKIDNFLFLVLSFTPVEFYSSFKSLYRKGNRN